MNKDANGSTSERNIPRVVAWNSCSEGSLTVQLSLGYSPFNLHQIMGVSARGLRISSAGAALNLDLGAEPR